MRKKVATDPNWLYSTIAQSSAAIVAIIGGFITASALTLNAELRGLWRKFNSLRRQLEDFEEKGKKETASELPQSEKSYIIYEAAGTRYEAATFRAPKHIWLGIAVLGYLSIVGILLPVIAIGYEIFNTTLRNWIIVLFSLGIIGIFFYIVFLIRILRRS